MPHWCCMMILTKWICFLCDIPRFWQAAYVVGDFISEPECQPVLRLPLYVQLDVNCWRVCCCPLWPAQSESASGWHSCRPAAQVSNFRKHLWHLLVCWCLMENTDDGFCDRTLFSLLLCHSNSYMNTGAARIISMKRLSSLHWCLMVFLRTMLWNVQ